MLKDKMLEKQFATEEIHSDYCADVIRLVKKNGTVTISHTGDMKNLSQGYITLGKIQNHDLYPPLMALTRVANSDTLISVFVSTEGYIKIYNYGAAVSVINGYFTVTYCA